MNAEIMREAIDKICDMLPPCKYCPLRNEKDGCPANNIRRIIDQEERDE